MAAIAEEAKELLNSAEEGPERRGVLRLQVLATTAARSPGRSLMHVATDRAVMTVSVSVSLSTDAVTFAVRVDGRIGVGLRHETPVLRPSAGSASRVTGCAALANPPA